MEMSDTDFGSQVNQLLHFPGSVGKFTYPSRSHETHENKGMSADILGTPKEYIFYMDVPGLSKSDIQVTVEEDNTLVIRSNEKRKQEDGEEGSKYTRLERWVPQKLIRKFQLPEDCNVSAITAKCENGVLTVVVEKQTPPPKPKTVQVIIA